MSPDINNYDLQNVECQPLLPSCEIYSRSKVHKAIIYEA